MFSSYTTQLSIEVTTTLKEHQRKLSQHQKFTAQLASVASEVSNVHFERRLGLLEDILVRWKEGDEVALMDVDEGEYTTISLRCCHFVFFLVHINV